MLNAYPVRIVLSREASPRTMISSGSDTMAMPRSSAHPRHSRHRTGDRCQTLVALDNIHEVHLLMAERFEEIVFGDANGIVSATSALSLLIGPDRLRLDVGTATETTSRTSFSLTKRMQRRLTSSSDRHSTSHTDVHGPRRFRSQFLDHGLSSRMSSSSCAPGVC